MAKHGRTEPARGGEEHDMLCVKCRRNIRPNARRAKAAKRSYNKRVRAKAKKDPYLEELAKRAVRFE